MRLLVDEIKGGASGGTIASVVNLLESTPFSKLAELGNPFSLAPRAAETGLPVEPTDATVVASGSDNSVPGFDPVIKKYTMPYIMQVSDTMKIIRIQM